MKKFFLFITILLLAESVKAQNFEFKHYGLSEGLSQETVRCIYKDTKGFLWIGTQDGLNLFDGNYFTTFRNSKKDSLSISGNFINSIIEGKKGFIWVGTNDNGICVYDANNEVFKKTKYNAGNCTSISRSEKGVIYATFLNKGLVIFNEGKTQLISDFKDEKLHFKTSYISNEKLYLGTTNGHLFVADISGKSKFALSEINIENKIGLSAINKILRNGNLLWIGTSRGLFAYDFIKKNVKKIKLQTGKSKKKLSVESIALNKKTLYVGTDSGLYILRYLNKFTKGLPSIYRYVEDDKIKNTITSNRVYDLLIDNDLFFIGTNKLDLVSLKGTVFKNLNKNSKPALNNKSILSILKYKEYTFIGTRHGINCINDQNEIFYITKENTNQKLAFNIIRGMAVDSENNLWVATVKGVSIINLNNFKPNKPKIKSIYHDLNDTLSLSSNVTRNIYIDHHKKVWITTYGGGINRFTGNVKNNKFTFIKYKNTNNTNSLSSNYTYNITQDKDLNYWITSENGLNKLKFESPNYTNPKFTKFYHEAGNSSSLNSSTTLHTYHDKDNVLWVATQDGFHKFNKENQTFTRFHHKDGLTNTFVYHILEDNNNNLWLSTNSGLFKFNKTTNQFSNYTPKDGLQSYEFNLGAAFNDKKNGILYFGGINGCNYFNPIEVNKLDKQGTLLFTNLLIKDKKIKPSDKKILSKSISNTKTININFDDFPLNLEFSALDFRPNKNNQFKYRLLPNDTQWNKLNTNNSIQLLNLHPEKYTLQVQGVNRDKLWSKQPLLLHINVKPPWYQSNLAYLSYLFLILLVVYFLYRIMLQRKLSHQETIRLQELDALKSRFITNITHEFRTPLTIVLGFISNLKEQYVDVKETFNSLNTIEKNSTSLLSLVNQMLDLAKLEQGKLTLNIIQSDIIAYLNYIIYSFSSIASDKNITLKFTHKVEKLQMDFDVEKIRQIFTNLIANAIKFSPEKTTVCLNLIVNGENVEISIIDQGYGMNERELNQIFERFYQVENKKFKISQGTGIGLALTKELVTLIKGSISVESVLNKGTTFKVILPLIQKAKKKAIDFKPINTNYGDIFVPKLEPKINLDDANTVLIVEDNEDMARYIASCLDIHFKITIAKNGQEGVRIATKQIPDLIITDIMMPIMDGYELTKTLQNNEITNHIPIIMLTSKAMQEDKMDGIISGADAYLTKPFDKKELLLRINKLISKREKLQKKYLGDTVNIAQPKSNDKNQQFLNKVIAIIYQHIEMSDFNADKLAQELTMSSSQLYRKLKAISNTSTSVFIRKTRLNKAKELLKTTNLTISEIAYATGFNDPNWFARVFKKEFGNTPTYFRK